jgi:hypothetical protein
LPLLGAAVLARDASRRALARSPAQAALPIAPLEVMDDHDAA